MRLRGRTLLSLILGLVAAAGVCAQNGAPRAGAVVKEMHGRLTVQSGTGSPESGRQGMAIPVGAILRTGVDSSAMLAFPDGQVCALSANSTLRIANYAYFPNDSSRNEMSLNLTDGSLRCVMGEIARLNPGVVRLQTGVATVGVTDSSAPRTDTSALVHGGTVAVTVDRGSVVVYLPSGQSQSIGAGQGMFLGQDGTVVSGATPKIIQELGALPHSDQKEFAAMDDIGQSIAVTVIMLANAATAQQLLAPLDSLPPPGQLAQSGPPVYGAASTPPTGAGGGGLPCTASCN